MTERNMDERQTICDVDKNNNNILHVLAEQDIEAMQQSCNTPDVKLYTAY